MLDDFKLDRNSKLPYYYQVYSYILNKINNKELPEGVQIPNEIDLCKLFNLSRTTIREALRELEQNGYISRGRGQGTFILKRNIEPISIQKVSSIVDELKEKGMDLQAKILEQKVIKSNERISLKLGVNKNIKLIYIKRLMSAGGEPLYLTKAYFPHDIFKKINKNLLTSFSFTKLLQEHFKYNITNKKRILRPDLPDDEIISLLDIKNNEKKVISYIETFWTFNYMGQERLIYFEEYFKGSKSVFVFES
jgi:GntR family transcriptional regulator